MSSNSPKKLKKKVTKVTEEEVAVDESVEITSPMYFRPNSKQGIVHKARSGFARKIGGYIFQYPAYTKVSHPIDILFFLKQSNLGSYVDIPPDADVIDCSADDNALIAFENSAEYLTHKDDLYSFYSPIGGS